MTRQVYVKSNMVQCSLYTVFRYRVNDSYVSLKRVTFQIAYTVHNVSGTQCPLSETIHSCTTFSDQVYKTASIYIHFILSWKLKKKKFFKTLNTVT